MRGRGVVTESLDRLIEAGLLHDVVAVYASEFAGAETAVVLIPLVAPSRTVRLVEQTLADVRHECVIVDRPARGVVSGSTGTKDGRTWRMGTQSDVSWINEGTESGPTIAAAIPPRYDAYATILTEDDAARPVHETQLLHVLAEHTPPQPWWLGYLDTGAHDVVFDAAPKVVVYSGWSYVLVQAGPSQAGRWRADDAWRGRLPDLLFPADRSWLVSMLWDDDWRCLGGPNALVQAILAEPGLDTRAVGVGEDATPPGHSAR